MRWKEGRAGHKVLGGVGDTGLFLPRVTLSSGLSPRYSRLEPYGVSDTSVESERDP